MVWRLRSIILTITGLIGTGIMRRRVNLNDHNTVARTLVAFYALVMVGVISLGSAVKLSAGPLSPCCWQTSSEGWPVL